MINSFKTLLFIYLFLASYFIVAQNSIVRFRNLSVENGLSEGDVKVIYQDHKGFIWIGTKDGLNRYDGNEFKIFTYDALDSTSLSDNFVYSIFEDSQHNLWIGTNNGGLNKYNYKTETFTSFQHNKNNTKSISQNTIISIEEDAKGNIWVGTDDNGLNLFHKESNEFERFTHDSKDSLSITTGSIWAILRDSRNNLWFGTQEGLDKLILIDDGKISFKHINFFNGVNVSSILEDSKGNLWVSTWDYGLIYFDPIKEKVIKHFYHNKNEVSNSLSSNIVKGVVEDNYGNFWVATDGGGLNKINKNLDQVHIYKNEEDTPFSLSNDNIWTIFKDKTGAIWLGLYANGLDVFDLANENIHLYTNNKNDKNSLSDNKIWSISGDNKNNIWVSTIKGIDNISLDDNREPNSFSPFKIKNKLLGFTNSIHYDKNGNLWAAIWGMGLLKFPADGYGKDYVKYSDYKSSDPGKLKAMMITFINSDQYGNLWIGSLSGLYKYDANTKEFTGYQHDPNNPNSLIDNYVYYILEDHEGFIWIGTNKGLNKLNPKTDLFITYTRDKINKNNLTHNKINFIHEDDQNNLWVGTDGGGLNLFDRSNNSFSSFTKAEGLANNSVKGITNDNNGNLWIITNNGLSFFNLNNKSFKNYKIEDGLQGKTFNRKAIFKDYKGFIYIGGNNGLNKFHPDSIKSNPIIPEVVLTDFKLFNTSIIPQQKNRNGLSPLTYTITNTEELVLDYNQNVFSFKFSALNYFLPYKNHYAYYLEGLEKEWNYIGNRREAYYTQVPFGSYEFKVKASNNDGIWNDKAVVLKINILPPWWHTWWFRVIILITLSLLAYSWYYSRVIIIHKQKRVLKKLVRERTAEIFHQKEELLQSAEELKIINEKLMASNKEMQIAKQEADKANKSKTQFLANMSHEIRSPLNAIVGFSQILIDQCTKLILPDSFQGNLGHIITAGQNLSELINNILDLSKIESGKVEIHLEELNFYKLVQGIYHINKESASKKNLIYNYNLSPDIPEFIFSDRTKLNQILMNLVSNAIKFTPETKSVTIEATLEEGAILIKVIDKGIGISEDRKKKVFESFEQADNTITRKYGGTGLGLSITKTMVDMIEGEIWVESQLGYGSVFYFKFPFQKVKNDAIKDVNWSFNELSFANENLVLIVEDIKVNRLMLKAFFDKIKLKVFFAINGLDAIQKTKDLKPNLILMDIHMPEMDGLEATKRIRLIPEFKETPIIALSADAFIQQQEKALEAKITNYLTKPIDFNKLISVLKKYLIENNNNLKKNTITHDIRKEIIRILEEMKSISSLELKVLMDQLDILKEKTNTNDSEILALFNELEDKIFSGESVLISTSIERIIKEFKDMEIASE